MGQSTIFSTKKNIRAFPKWTIICTFIRHLEKLQAKALISKALQVTSKMNGNTRRHLFRLALCFLSADTLFPVKKGEP